MYEQLNFETLLDIIQLSNKCIMADAFVCNRSIDFAKYINTTFNKNIKYTCNEYVNYDKTAVILGIAKSFNALQELQLKFINHILDALTANKKICVSLGSRTFKEVLFEAIRQRFGDDFIKNQILHYDVNSDDEVMKQLDDVTTNWGKLIIRMIAFTTKITCGIDFSTIGIVDRTYIYATSFNPIARDLIQSHFRVRHTNENKIYVAIYAGITTNLEETPTLIQEIKKHQIIDKKFHSFEKVDIYRKIADYNALEETLGRYAYDKMFLYYLKKTGYNIVYDKLDSTNENKIDTKELKNAIFTKNFISDYNSDKQIAKYLADDIIKKIKKSQASKSEMVKLEAYKFYTYIIKKTTLLENTDDDIIKITTPEFIEECKTNATNYDLSLRDYLECNLYNTYKFKRHIRDNIDNMILEAKKIDINEFIKFNRNEVNTKRKYIMKLESIKNLCTTLNIKNTYDTVRLTKNENSIIRLL
jgi:hypothetical protein